MPSALEGADVVMSLRMKHEYQKDFYVPSMQEYTDRFLITTKLMEKYAPDAAILAPGPFIRGTEIDSPVVDGDKSLISNQVTNGVAVRMALLFLLSLKQDKKSPEEIKEEMNI